MDRPPRKSHSPSRNRLSALSPLQAFSPLQPEPLPLDSLSLGRSSRSRSASASSAFSTGSGLRRSVSSRERLFRSDDNYNGGDYPSGITTRLILVKAPQENEPPLRQRSKSSSNLQPVETETAASNAPATSLRRPRRSFAAASFSSFGPMSPVDKGTTDNLDEQPQRPSFSSISVANEGIAQGTTGPGLSRTLSPDQVLELARGLMSPVAAPEGDMQDEETTRASRLERRKSTGSATAHGGAGGSAKTEPIELEPVDYVQMDEDTLLPYSDRPTQVAELLHNPVNADMINMIKQTFPQGKVRDNWHDIDVTKWNWDEFILHLTVIGRSECPDYEWVLLARTAVREHSPSAWEALGACLGCDGELITAGDEEDGTGTALGEEEEESLSRVHIEALEAVDPQEQEEQERMLSLHFGEPVEDTSVFGDSPTSVMATIGERDEPSSNSASVTTSSSASNIDIPKRTSTSPISSKVDPNPFTSPISTHRRTFSRGSNVSATSDDSSSPSSPVSSLTNRPNRARSFVGLQIMTTDTPRSPRSSSSIDLPSSPGMVVPHYERTPGNPLFVSSFNTLSLGPNLGRSASSGFAAVVGGAPSSEQIAQYNRRHMARKLSGTGLSESAITFVSDSSGF